MAFVSTAILIFTLLIAGLCALKGFFSGAIKQGVRFGLLILSVIGSIFATRAVYSIFVSNFKELSAAEILAEVDKYVPVLSGDGFAWLQNLEADAVLYVLAIPFALILLPLMFIPIFLILNGLGMIIAAIINKVSGINKMNKNLGLRLGGMGIGLVQGVIISAMILMPVAGLSPYIEEAMNTVEIIGERDQASAKVADQYDEYVAPITEGTSVKLLTFFGGSIVYDMIASVDVGDKNVNMTELIPDVATIYSESMKCEGMDWKHLTPAQEQSVRAIVTTFKSNSYMTAVSAEIVSAFSGAVSSGEFAFDVNSDLDNVLKSFFEVFARTDSKTVGEDIDTLVELYLVLAGDGFFTALDSENSSEAMLEVFTKETNGKTIVNKVVEILRSNKRTSELVGIVTKLSLNVMAQSMELGEEAEQVYESVKDGLNSALAIEKEGKTEEEYIEELSNSIDNTLRDNGIEVEKEIVDKMADFVNENFEAGVELGDDEVSDIIISYYDAYIDYVNNGGEPPIDGINPDDLENLIPDGINPDDIENLFPGLNPDDLENLIP